MVWMWFFLHVSKHQYPFMCLMKPLAQAFILVSEACTTALLESVGSHAKHRLADPSYLLQPVALLLCI